MTITNDDAQPTTSTTAAVSPTSSSAVTSSTSFVTPSDTSSGTVTSAATSKGTFVATVTPDKGVYFTITGGGHGTYLTVRVTCDSRYATTINVPLDANGNGTSQTIYPPTGSSCTATLEDPQGINRSRVLATLTFQIP